VADWDENLGFDKLVGWAEERSPTDRGRQCSASLRSTQPTTPSWRWALVNQFPACLGGSPFAME